MKDSTTSGHTANLSQQQSHPKNWVYINGLGERDAMQVADSDVLSTIKFSQSGEYLALGDHGGRVIIFKKSLSPSASGGSGNK